MTNKEKVIKELKEVLDSLDVTNKYRLNLIRAIEYLQKEPVSGDLEEASKEWLIPQLDKSYAAHGETKQMELTHFDGYAMLDAIEFGAEWKEEQFEKNRLAHSDAQTEEEAEIERDFVMSITENEHRQPTFDDAIKYGMRLKEKEMQSTIELAEDHAMLAGMEKMKEQMMTKSIEAVVSQVPCSNEIILYNPSSVDRYYLPQEMNKLGLNKGDKIKLVIIKED